MAEKKPIDIPRLAHEVCRVASGLGLTRETYDADVILLVIGSRTFILKVRDAPRTEISTAELHKLLASMRSN